MPEQILAMVLAGGEGERLYPLTRDRAKPAVPFGGIYRIIDFTLSNCLNSGLRRDHTSSPSTSPYPSTATSCAGLEHLQRRAGRIHRPHPGPAAGRRATGTWGPADAIYQNIYVLAAGPPGPVSDPLRGPHLQDELPGNDRLSIGRSVRTSPPRSSK